MFHHLNLYSLCDFPVSASSTAVLIQFWLILSATIVKRWISSPIFKHPIALSSIVQFLRAALFPKNIFLCCSFCKPPRARPSSLSCTLPEWVTAHLGDWPRCSTTETAALPLSITRTTDFSGCLFFFPVFKSALFHDSRPQTKGTNVTREQTAHRQVSVREIGL